MVSASEHRGPKVADLTNTLDMVKLCSNDDKVFFLNRDVACQSAMLKERVKTASRIGSTQTRVISLDLNAKTLETVVKYLHYRCINSRLAKTDRAEFVIEPEEALHILQAAIYLRC